MAEVDLEELFESVLDGKSSAIPKTIDALVELWDEEDWESVEIFAEETLTDETPKKFVTQILALRESKLDFVEDFVASIDGRPIVATSDFPILMEMLRSSRESDSDEFNATRSGRASAALNPECPTKLLAELARDENWEIRYRVALNPSATSEVLDSILDGSYPDGLEFLAEHLEATIALHKNSSDALLEKLSASENSIVRSAVACNPNASAKVIEQAKSLGVDVRLIRQGEFRNTRLCWWFGDSNWTLADLEDLKIS